MSVTIESLDIQIRSSAGSAAQNINALATALGNLNANARVTKIVNSLNNLNVALTNMRSQQAVMTHLAALSKSLAGLAAIPRLTGLQSAIRELTKLPAVMQNLNTAQISQFSGKMQLLANAMAPLATQITAIGAGFARLPRQTSQCVTAIRRLDAANRSVTASTQAHGAALNTTGLNLMTAYANLTMVLSIMHSVQDGFARLMDDAIQWDGIQFRFGRAFGDDAEMVLEYARKVSDELRINLQQFMQYSSLYGSLLKGFGMEQETVTTISVGLTELSYDIWAAYNDRYRTLEDASEAIRSAITGEIEPIRNAGIALTEASMQEFADGYNAVEAATKDTVTALEDVQNATAGIGNQAKETGNAITNMVDNGISNAALQATADTLGLGMSVEKMTEAQKSELRYAVMVNAAMNQGIVGTYAREMNTAEGAVRTLTQQLKTLGQALGSLFLPILQKVLPWISAFVELLTEGLIALGAMFGIEFQEITWGDTAGMADGANATADALGEAAKNAKKAKDYTLGFDELNVINPDSNSKKSGAGDGADGSGLGLDLDTLWDQAVFDSASKKIDELKDKIKAFYKEWKFQLETIGYALSALSIASLLTSLGKALNLGNLFLGTMSAIKSLAVGAIIITLQYSLATEFLGNYLDGEGFKNYIAAMFVNALGTWVLYSKFGVAGLAIGLAVTAVASLSAIVEDGGIHSAEGAVTALTGLAAAIGAVGFAAKGLKGSRLVGDLGAAFALLRGGESLGGVLSAMFPTAANIVTTASGWVTGTLVPAIGSVLSKIPMLLGMAIRLLPWAALLTAIVGAITLAVADYDFTDIGYKIGHALGTALKKVGEFLGKAGKWFVDVGKSILSGIDAAWEWVKKEFDINNVFELILLMFNPVSWITKILPKMLEIGKEVLPGLWKGIKDGWNNFWGNIEELIDGFLEGFRDALGIHSPSTLFAEIGSNIIAGLIGGVSKKWEDLKTWFNQTVKPKFTLEYWATKFDVIRQAVATKLEEFKQTAIEKWNGIKTWFAGNIAPKFTLKFWLDKFKNLKEGFTQTIKNAVNAGIDLMNKFIGWLNEKLNFSWDALSIAGKEVFPAGSIQLFTIPKIPRLAEGGFVGAGQMFIAREAGPELVGNIRGKTAVANNDQIVAAVAEGVYSAVVSAMNATNGQSGQSINVYLDGKQITAAVEKRQNERGRTLMGNQLGYVY